ncbi:glycosyltransferase [Pelagibius sp. CAU 1746]|uniref:glycosyltransferase family 2 protein n=1 Tax=Pelagibius sp. CAU 1746 TaxID=3140370 RepID=UPI00325A71B5
MPDPAVYLLVPVHNRRDITVEFARFVSAQTCENLQFVLIDDGSTDGTAEAVRAESPGVKIIHGDGNLWWGGALQKGLDYLHDIGADDDSVVVICNDDVVIDEGFIETGVRLLKTKPNSLLLAQHRDSQDGLPKETGVAFDDVRMLFSVAPEPKDINCLSTRGLFLTLKTARGIGRFHTRILNHYGSDYEWTIRAGRKGFELWTDPRLTLIPMYEKTGHRPSASPTFSECMKLYMAKHSTSNVFMRTVLYALTGSRRHLPMILCSYWLACIRAAFAGARESLRLGLGAKGSDRGR